MTMLPENTRRSVDALAESGFDLDSLRAKAADMRGREPVATQEIEQFSMRRWDLAKLSAAIFTDGRPNEGRFPIFRTSSLNFSIISKEVVPKSAQIQLRPYQLATKVFIPYDVPEDAPRKTGGNDHGAMAGRSFYVGQRNYHTILRHHFMGGMPPEEQETDLLVLDLLNSLPSLDPFLLKDRFRSKEMDIDPAYLQIDESRWQMIKSSIIDDFTPIALRAFGQSSQLRMQTSILVEKLWEARDLEALAPLTAALKVNPKDAGTIYYAWKGILFYKTQYEAAIKKMDAFFGFINWNARSFANIAPAVTQNSWHTPLKTLRVMIGEVQYIMTQYTRLRNDFAGEGRNVGDFIKFFHMAPDFFWLIGGHLSCFELCLEILEDFRRAGQPTANTIDTLLRSTIAIAEHGRR